MRPGGAFDGTIDYSRVAWLAWRPGSVDNTRKASSNVIPVALSILSFSGRDGGPVLLVIGLLLGSDGVHAPLMIGALLCSDGVPVPLIIRTCVGPFPCQSELLGCGLNVEACTSAP